MISVRRAIAADASDVADVFLRSFPERYVDGEARP